MTEQSGIKYFHCYATANNSIFYFEDIMNLQNLWKNNPGVEKVYLSIAISTVLKINFMDKLFANTIKKLFNKHPSIILLGIYFKENKGRDFSSYSFLNNKIKSISSPKDFVFFQNRSGYGPFIKDWYLSYIQQLEKFKDVALCGSTINFKDHPERSDRTDKPHIQTYAFLTKVEFLMLLGETFPGENENQRLQIILNGEIGLSKFFLDKSYGITCMEWPDQLILKDSPPVSLQDQKTKVIANHPFFHRQYFRKKSKLRAKLTLGKQLFYYIKFIVSQ